MPTTPTPDSTTDVGSISAKLADAEQASNKERVRELLEVSDLIDDILQRHEVTWGEFQRIVDAYSNRSFVALNGMTIKSLKHHYDNPIIRIRESKVGQG